MFFRKSTIRSKTNNIFPKITISLKCVFGKSRFLPKSKNTTFLLVGGYHIFWKTLFLTKSRFFPHKSRLFRLGSDEHVKTPLPRIHIGYHILQWFDQKCMWILGRAFFLIEKIMGLAAARQAKLMVQNLFPEFTRRICLYSNAKGAKMMKSLLRIHTPYMFV